MTVSTFTQPDYSSQSGASYKAAIDGAAHVHNRVAGPFAPHAADTPDMKVYLDGGVIPAAGGLPTEVAAQDTGTLTAPSANPRKDIVHIDRATGVVGVATGTEDPSPSDPAVPSGKIAAARINWTAGMTEITNADLDDLRTLSMLGLGDVATADFASQAQAEAGSDNATSMTPLRVAQAVAALLPLPSQAEAEAGTATTPRSWSAERVAQAVAALGGGMIVQTARTVDTTQISTTSTSFVDSGLSVSLTGVASGSTVRFTVVAYCGVSTSDARVSLELRRDTTSLVPSGANEHASVVALSHGTACAVATVDDTGHGGGSLTYRLYWRTNTGTVWLGKAHDSDANVQAPITLTLEEIAA